VDTDRGFFILIARSVYLNELSADSVLLQMASFNIDTKKLLENVFIDDMIKKIPRLRSYKHRIKFTHVGTKMTASFDDLPLDLVKEINKVYGND